MFTEINRSCFNVFIENFMGQYHTLNIIQLTPCNDQA